MTNYNCVLGCAAILSVAIVSAYSQEPEREMTCDNGWQNDLVSHCEINEMTIAAQPGLSVDGGVNGSMTVRGWKRHEILVRARVEPAARSDADARDIARRIVIHTGGGQIRAEGPQLENHQNWSVSYEIFVPQQINLNLKAHNGGIRIANVRGSIEFDALNGGVSLVRLGGNVRGHTTNGGLKVELAGSRWDGEQLDAYTTNGGVSFQVPDNYSAHLETGTVNGHINVDFPVSVHGEINRRLSIDLRSGGALVRAVTTNGGVSIQRKSM